MSDHRVAICEDEASQASLLEHWLKEWAGMRDHLLSIDLFSSAESFLFRYAERKDYDLLLLDIEMSGMNGIELAKRIRETDREIQLVFVTGYADYIAEGYDVSALHYLLKPVSQEKLFSVLDRATERIHEHRKDLYFQAEGESVRLPLYEVRYVEVFGNYVTVHADREYPVRSTLQEMEKSLDDGFFRTGRSHIVNLRFVARIGKSKVVLKDGTELPLSKSLYESMNQAFIRYF